MNIILMLNLLMSSMFLFLKHPLSLGVTLLIQTILIALMTGGMTPSLWFSYIMFLILIGGMMILFIYMTSIASNEKFKKISIMKPLAIFPPLIMLMLMMKPFTPWTNETINMNKTIELNYNMTKFINIPLSAILIFLISYLLVAMILSVKITEFKKGPIRQLN